MQKKQYYDSQYEIWEDGTCINIITNHILKPQMTSHYPTYNLTLNGKKKKIKIHRMVAEMFLPRIDGKNIVNHIDGNTKNFLLENLEWVNEKENSRHAINTGLRKSGDQTINKFIDNLPGEEWKAIQNYSNYIVSNCGRVMNIFTKRLLKPAISNSGGYYEVNLWRNNSGKVYRIHQLVYVTFSGDYDLKGYVINHIDGNKHNNNFNNLEKITYAENNYHSVYVINTNQSNKPVLQYDLLGNFIKEYASIREAETITKCNCISRAIKYNYKTCSPITGQKYVWKFKDND